MPETKMDFETTNVTDGGMAPPSSAADWATTPIPNRSPTLQAYGDGGCGRGGLAEQRVGGWAGTLEMGPSSRRLPSRQRTIR